VRTFILIGADAIGRRSASLRDKRTKTGQAIEYVPSPGLRILFAEPLDRFWLMDGGVVFSFGLEKAAQADPGRTETSL
jgi:hypothetical protein